MVLGLLVAGAGIGVGQQSQGETEPNDQQSQANSILSETRVTGILGLNDDDWFAFEADPGDRILIEISGVSGTAQLRAPNGDPLDSDSPTIDRLQATAEESGTYDVQISQSVTAVTGDYSMTVQLNPWADQTATSANDSTTTTTTVIPGPTAPDTTNGSSSSGTPANTSTGDQWPDNCDAASPVAATGSYNGTINSPDDVDTFKISLPVKGDFVTMQARAPVAEDRFSISFVGPVSTGNTQAEDGVSISNAGLSSYAAEGLTNNTSWAVFSEEENATVCVEIREHNPSSAQLPCEWAVSLNKNSHGPYPLEGEVLSPAEIRDFEQRLAALEERVAELEEQVNETESG